MNTHALLAQINNPVLPLGIGGGNANYETVGPTAIGKFIGSSASIIFLVSFIFAFLYLVLGGLNWITSSGDKAKLEVARGKITNAIVGIVIVGASWAIFLLVAKFMGITTAGTTVNFKLPTFDGP